MMDDAYSVFPRTMKICAGGGISTSLEQSESVSCIQETKALIISAAARIRVK
jgi:hypothetical protein